MAISKLILNGVTQMDVTDDTVTANNLLLGAQATGADGQKVIGAMASGDVTELRNEIIDFGGANLIPIIKTNTTASGVTFTWNENNTVTITGTATASTYGYVLYENRIALPHGMVAGGTYHFHHDDSANIVFRIHAIDGSNTETQIYSAVRGGNFTIPSGTVGLLVRFYLNNARAYNATIPVPYFFATHNATNAIVGLYHGYPTITYNSTSKEYTVQIDSTVRVIWNNGVRVGTTRIQETYTIANSYYLAYSLDSDTFSVVATPTGGNVLTESDDSFVICLYNTNGQLSGQWAVYYVNAKVDEILAELNLT